MKTENSLAQDGLDTDQLNTASWSGPRKVAFYSVIAVLLIGINGAFWRVNLFPLLAWFPDDFLNRFYLPQLEFDGISVGDFTHHKIHYLAISASHWGSCAGSSGDLLHISRRARNEFDHRERGRRSYGNMLIQAVGANRIGDADAWWPNAMNSNSGKGTCRHLAVMRALV